MIFFAIVHSSLKAILYTLSTERERLKTALEAEGGGGGGSHAVIATLRNTLHQTIQQNSDLRARLNRIHESSDLSDVSETVSIVYLLYKLVNLKLSADKM